MIENTPKVLLISHAALGGEDNDGKTLASLLSLVPKERLAHLNFSGKVPDLSICDSVFSISYVSLHLIFPWIENTLAIKWDDIISEDASSIIKDKITGVQKIVPKTFTRRAKNFVVHRVIGNTVFFIYKELAKFFFKWHAPFRSLLINRLVGKRWHTKEVDLWLDSVNPDVVFFQSSCMFFPFDIAEYICKRYEIPMIMESTDDYFTGKFSINPFFWIDLHGAGRRYNRAVKYSHCVYAIGDKMAAEYSRRFGGRFKVAMNSVDIEPLDTQAPPPGKMQILYAGNLHSGRWKILEKVGKAVKFLEAQGIDAELVICSLTKMSRKILHRLSIPGRMRFIGALDSEQMRQERANSTLLLHVENFAADDRTFTRLSVSTKIPEYMASGRCIFAVGPGDVASMEYIKDYNMGVTVNTLKVEDIVMAIKDILIDNEKRKAYIANAYRTVCGKHDRKKVAEDVKKELLSACSGGDNGKQ